MRALLSIDVDEEIQNTSEEVDALFDYMDERVSDGANSEDIVAALMVVLMLVAEETGEMDVLH